MRIELGLIVLALSGFGCGNGGGNGNSTPTPPPTNHVAAAWTGATASFDGLNNPSDNALCVTGGPNTVTEWTGSATADVTGGGQIVIGDVADRARHVVAAECMNDQEVCLGADGDPSDETLDVCLVLYFFAGVAPVAEENLQENLLYIIIPDAPNQWSPGTFVLGTPIENGTQPYAYGLSAIDNNFNNQIDTDGNGDPVAPDTEILTGLTLDGLGGTVEFTSTGINDGEPTVINGTTTITLSPEPSSFTGLDPNIKASMRRLAARARDEVRRRKAE